MGWIGEPRHGRAAAGGERDEASGEMGWIGEPRHGRAAAGGERDEASGDIVPVRG
jgi:hypothetical protein